MSITLQVPKGHPLSGAKLVRLTDERSPMADLGYVVAFVDCRETAFFGGFVGTECVKRNDIHSEWLVDSSN